MAKPISIYELEADEKRFFSPFCWAARLAIVQKKIPVETIRWRFREQDKIAFSGQKLVPVIVDANQDGKFVNDSWAIAKYLEATYPDRTSLFGGPAGEAGALFIVNWFYSGPVVALMQAIMLDLHNSITPDLQGWFRETREKEYGSLEEFTKGEAGIPDFQKSLEPLRQTLGEFPYLGGKEGPSYADIFVFGMFMFAYAISPKKLLEKDDPVYAWRQRMFDAFASETKKAIGHPESL